jgi:4-amino-4-deoxy-L-arabinose transferase-like glycosyltransferase
MQETAAHDTALARAEPRALLRHWEWPAIAAIALAAFAIRAWTVRGGLPYVDHPDEPNPINYVVEMLRTGDPNPHAFQKPSLYVYLLLAALTLHYRLGLASGLYEDLGRMNVTTHLYTTIPGFFLWGRLLTTAIATLTVVFVFLIGRRMWGRDAGLIAALFLALSPFHMRHSQYVTTDVASGWLVLLAFGASLAVARAGRWRDYLAAGAFAGLAAAAKYNAGVAALMVVVAHVLYWWERGTRNEERGTRLDHGPPATGHGPRTTDNPQFWGPLLHLPRLVGAGAAALLGFVAGTPYALLSWDEFRRGILGQVEDYTGITHGDFTGPWNVRGYLGFFMGGGLGWAGCALLAAGLALLLWRRRAAGLLWLSFALPYLLLHLAQSSHFTRNMLPVVVLSAIPIGVAGAALIEGLWRAIERLPADSDEGRRTKDEGTFRLSSFALRPIAFTATAGVLLGLLLPGALETWRYSARLSRGDTRVHALEWVDANVPPGVRVAAELRALPGSIESRWAEAPGLLRHDLAWYRRQGYAYLIASSDAWGQWAIPAGYAAFAGRPPVAEFGGASPRDMLGPRLAVYATGLSGADAPGPLRGDVRVGGARLVGAALGRPEPKAPQLGLEPAREIEAGHVLALRTFWSVEQPFEQDFFIFVHILDAAGSTVAQRDTPPWQGRFPTSSWRAGTLVVDVNDVPLPASLPPGDYTIVLGMFDPASGARPPMSQDGRPIDMVQIGRIAIKK